MKRQFIILINIFVLTLLSCTDKTTPYKDLKLPDDIEYNQIISEILKQDTTLFSDYIGADLVKSNIMFVRPERDTINVATIDFHTPRTSLLELKYYNVTDSVHRKIDSLYFSFQNDSAKQTALDKKLLDFVKLATNEIIIKNKGSHDFGYLQFSLPILNKTLDKAFVQTDIICSGLCGEGKIFVLEKINGKWTIKFSKITWVG